MRQIVIRVNSLINKLALAALLWGASAAPVHACSVCGGDSNSDMVKGAFSGVIVMVAITYGLLMGFVALGATWFIRARRLAASQSIGHTADRE